jgi:hypothetical protein
LDLVLNNFHMHFIMHKADSRGCWE